jgi:hypothetical protein
VPGQFVAVVAGRAVLTAWQGGGPAIRVALRRPTRPRHRGQYRPLSVAQKQVKCRTLLPAGSGERANAQLKSWRRLPPDPQLGQVTALVKAVMVLIQAG